MALALKVNQIEEVPETLREHYAAQPDGTFRLQADGFEDEKKSLHSALKAERSTNSAWRALGKSPEEVVAALAKAADRPEDKTAELATLLQQKEQAWTLEKKTLTGERDAAKSSERAALMDATLAAALTKAKATAEAHSLLPRQLADRIKFDLVDGRRKITVLDDAGQPMTGGTGPGGVATITDLVMRTRDSYPSLFEGSGAGGGAKNPADSPRPRTIMTRREFGALPQHEKPAAARRYTLID